MRGERETAELHSRPLIKDDIVLRLADDRTVACTAGAASRVMHALMARQRPAARVTECSGLMSRRAGPRQQQPWNQLNLLSLSRLFTLCALFFLVQSTAWTAAAAAAAASTGTEAHGRSSSHDATTRSVLAAGGELAEGLSSLQSCLNTGHVPHRVSMATYKNKLPSLWVSDH